MLHPFPLHSIILLSKFIILSGLETPEVNATIIIPVIDLIYPLLQLSILRSKLSKSEAGKQELYELLEGQKRAEEALQGTVDKQVVVDGISKGENITSIII